MYSPDVTKGRIQREDRGAPYDCCSDFSVGHGGANDVQTHIQSKKHKSFVDSSAGTSSIAKFFQPKITAL